MSAAKLMDEVRKERAMVVELEQALKALCAFDNPFDSDRSPVAYMNYYRAQQQARAALSKAAKL